MQSLLNLLESGKSKDTATALQGLESLLTTADHSKLLQVGVIQGISNALMAEKDSFVQKKTNKSLKLDHLRRLENVLMKIIIDFGRQVPKKVINSVLDHVFNMHSPIVFDNLILNDGKLLNHLFSFPENRNTLTVNQFLDIIGFCDSILQGNDENGKCVSTGVLYEFSKLMQVMIICYPRDWSSHQGKQAIWVLECILRFFETFLSENSAHPILLISANHVIFEWGINSPKMACNLARKISILALKFIQSKNGIRIPLLSLLRLYLDLSDFLKVVERLDYHSMSLILIWDALQYDFSARFKNVIHLISDVDKLVSKIPILSLGEFMELKLDTNSWESISFCDVFANVTCSILDFQSNEEGHAINCDLRDSCGKRVFHIQPLLTLHYAFKKLMPENYLVCQIIFLMFLKYADKIPEKHQKLILGMLMKAYKPISDSASLWILVAITQVLHVMKADLVEWDSIVNIIMSLDYSEAALGLFKVIVRKRKDILFSKLGEKLWDVGFSKFTEQSLCLIQNMIFSNYPGLDSKRYLKWMSHSLITAIESCTFFALSINSILIALGQKPLSLDSTRKYLEDENFASIPFQSEKSTDVFILEMKHYQFFYWISFSVNGFNQDTVSIALDEKLADFQEILSCIVDSINHLSTKHDQNLEWSKKCLYFFLVIHFLLNYILKFRLYTDSMLEDQFKKPLLSLSKKFVDYLRISNSAPLLDYEFLADLQKLRFKYDLASVHSELILPKEFSSLMNHYFMQFIECCAPFSSSNKRKRESDRWQDNDSDQSPGKPKNMSIKKTVGSLSSTALLYNNSAFNADLETESILVLRRINSLLSMRYYCEISSVLVSKPEIELFLNVLKDQSFHRDMSLVKFYSQFSTWISICAKGLDSYMVSECLSVISYILNLPFLSKNCWVLCDSLNILYSLLPVIKISSKEVIEIFKKLITAFTLLLKGKSNLRSSDDLCVIWKVLVIYIKVYIKCIDLNMDKIAFNNSDILESARLLYMISWTHHHFECRMTVPLYLNLATKPDLIAEFDTICERPFESALFFISGSWFCKIIAILRSHLCLAAVLKLLEVADSDYKMFFVSFLLHEMALNFEFESSAEFLAALLDQRLLFCWKHGVETLPYVLFGFSNQKDFLCSIIKYSLPKMVCDSQWELISQFFPSSGNSVATIFRKYISQILVELLGHSMRIDDLTHDLRWKYVAKMSGLMDPFELIRKDPTSIFRSSLLLIDDEKRLRSWNEDVDSLWNQFDSKFQRSHGKRPLLNQALSMKVVSMILDYIFQGESQLRGSYISIGDFQLLLEWFDRILENERFQYERYRILANGYAALLYLNPINLTHPLVFHMLIRTITFHMQEPMNIEPLSIILMFVFTYAAKYKVALIRDSGLHLINLMTDLLSLHQTDEKYQKIISEVRTNIQSQVADLDIVMKSLSEYQLTKDPSKIRFELKDIFDISHPNDFQFFMIDHLDAILNIQSTKDVLKANHRLCHAIIDRLLVILRSKRNLRKSILKIGYILGQLLLLSKRKSSSDLFLDEEASPEMETLIFEALKDEVYSGGRKPREIASLTLTCILNDSHLFSFAAKSLDEKSFNLIRIFRDRTCKSIIKPPKSIKNYSLKDVWDIESCENWISSLANGILTRKSQDGILSFLPAILEASPGIAETLLPFIVFEQLNDPEFKGFFERLVQKVLSSPDTCQLQLTRAIIRTIDFIRKQNHPESATLFENHKKWMNIDYLNLSKAAAVSDMPYHALYFAEIALIDGISERYKYFEMLADIYKKLDDPDAFIGIMMLMNSSQVTETIINEKLKCQKAWSRLTQSQEAQLIVHPDKHEYCNDLAIALRSQGDFFLLNRTDFRKTEISSKILLEAKWRCNNWDEYYDIAETNSDPFSRDAIIHKCLSALNIGSINEYKRCIDDSYVGVIDLLQKSSFYDNDLLLSLVFLSDFHDITLLETNIANISDVLLRWNQNCDHLLENYGFEIYEPIMACRTQILLSYRKNNKQDHLNYLADHILAYSKMCRKNDFLQGSLVSMCIYKTLNFADQEQFFLFGIKTLNGILERLKILWIQNERLLAIRLLKDVIKKILENTDSSSKSTDALSRCYGLVGGWIAEAKSESSNDVIKFYFTPAISNASAMGKNHYKLAIYADEQYGLLLREYESLGTLHEDLAKYKKDQLASIESSLSKFGDADKFKLDRARKQMQLEVEMDRNELKRLEDLRNDFLSISVQNYLLTLSSSERKWDMSVFRLIALWFSNCKNSNIGQLIQKQIPSIKSSRFLVIIYQLSARLLTITNEEEDFCQVLVQLLYKMSVDHPYHCLHHILALVNTEKINKNSNRASQLLGILKKPLSRVIQEFDIIMRGYISLSSVPYNPKDKDRSIPATNYLLRISDSNLSIPPLTMDLEVNNSCKYNAVPSISKFEPSYFVPGGINAPKVISCLASNGKKYRQLVKGNDDLRQDAVLIKIFEILNILLAKRPQARNRNLNIRTYKVVPLSPKAGVVQWVENTDTFSNILLPAHKKYNPFDWKPEKCREVMSKEQNRKSSTMDSKLLVFQQVCDNFSPAFKYLFYEYYREPETWHQKRNSFTRSIATSSIAGWIAGLGDRHINNILFDRLSAEAIHIDLGIAFDQGKLLSTPEQVPFRLTRDLVDVMGITGVEGVFRIACEETLRVLRSENKVILMILEVFRHDPLYKWSASDRRQEKLSQSNITKSSAESAIGNKEAARALLGVQKKLLATTSVECQINELIQVATDPKNLSRMFSGWQGNQSPN